MTQQINTRLTVNVSRIARCLGLLGSRGEALQVIGAWVSVGTAAEPIDINGTTLLRQEYGKSNTFCLLHPHPVRRR